MGMISLLICLFSCNKEVDWTDLLESKRCRANPTCAKTKKGLLLNECLEQQNRTVPLKAKETDAIIHFCDALVVSDDATTVACGLAACADLSEISPQSGLERLVEISKADAAKKKQQQAIIMGFLRSEEHFNSALKASVTSKRNGWWGLAVAEVDCGAASISNQVNQPCSKPMPTAAETVLSSATSSESTLFESLTAYNLALALNPELEIKMAEMATDENGSTIQIQSAAQALRVHYKRTQNRSLEADKIIQNACLKPKRELMGLCKK